MSEQSSHEPGVEDQQYTKVRGVKGPSCCRLCHLDKQADGLGWLEVPPGQCFKLVKASV